MTSLYKRILRSRPVTRLAADAISVYIRLVYLTSRWETRGIEHPAAFWNSGRAFVGAFWHGRLLMMPLCWPPSQPMHVLSSYHGDGELIARAMDRFHLQTVRGSTAKDGRSDKGGRAALRTILRLLKRGESVTFTPDGPRGPRMRASIGIVAAARLAGVPVMPVTYAVKRRRLADSWDRFIIPSPFNRGLYLWGAPIEVSDPAEPLEQAALRVEVALTALSDEADRLCGQTPVPPAERRRA
jgi:lysophospholipid acyltransferase (LPLAT)-like uncharacterized protein